MFNMFANTMIAERKIILLFVIILFLSFSSCSQKKAATEKQNFMYTNELIHETSPYLLQHAHNPVNWYPWGDKALEIAKKENKM